jgi:hypothetical protein
MAYNFEGTFVQPLLTQLDNGLIKGADDWADAITKAYINTVKAGLPQGAPSTLPAPHLSIQLIQEANQCIMLLELIF